METCYCFTEIYFNFFNFGLLPRIYVNCLRYRESRGMSQVEPVRDTLRTDGGF